MKNLQAIISNRGTLLTEGTYNKRKSGKWQSNGFLYNSF